MLKNKKIAFYVTGGIAVYKAVDLMRTFIKNGAEVRVAMTESAQKFVTPLTFQILSKNEVYIDTFSEQDPSHVSHIDLADWADMAVVAPATANIIAKISHGIADDFVTSSFLAFNGAKVIVPAMNTKMYENEATQDNIKLLLKRKMHVVEPATGFLAEGYEGKGRFPEGKIIIEEIEYYLFNYEENLPLKNKKILISAGGTKERIDPVRFISNDSSGKMGHAIAYEAYKNGADVTLVTASSLDVPKGINKISVGSADEMYKQIDDNFKTTDVLIMAAAVSDYKVKNLATNKIKKEKNNNTLQIDLQENKDILKSMSKKKKNQYLIGFAAETEHLEKYAKKKLKEKNLDMIIANDVSRPDSGFNVDENKITIFTKDDKKIEFEKDNKKYLAKEIIQQLILELL